MSEYTTHSFNEELAEDARRAFDRGRLTLAEFEERLDAYLRDGAPERIHWDELLRRPELAVMDDDPLLFGETYIPADHSCEWFVREDSTPE